MRCGRNKRLRNAKRDKNLEKSPQLMSVFVSLVFWNDAAHERRLLTKRPTITKNPRDNEKRKDARNGGQKRNARRGGGIPDTTPSLLSGPGSSLGRFFVSVVHDSISSSKTCVGTTRTTVKRMDVGEVAEIQ